MKKNPNTELIEGEGGRGGLKLGSNGLNPLDPKSVSQRLEEMREKLSKKQKSLLFVQL